MLYSDIFLFPIKLGVTLDEEFSYKNDLIEWIHEYKDKDVNNTVELSNRGGYQTMGNFYREPGGEGFDPFLDKIWKQICETIQNYSEGIMLKEYLNTNTLNLVNIWINVNGPGAFNHVHQHPGSVLSGVFWVKSSEKSGFLNMMDPLEMNTYCLGPNMAHFEPIEGKMIVFPSCLPHNVDTNNDEETRISISFNLDFG
jgi:uncharacterized protein (TIGR02466 family)